MESIIKSQPKTSGRKQMQEENSILFDDDTWEMEREKKKMENSN